jgi:phage terminase large subunit GpA-like protein
MLVCGVDVQKDGVYFEYVAYGRRGQSWSVDSGFLPGDIYTTEFKEEIHTVIFDREFAFAASKYGYARKAEKICFDAGAYTQECYACVRLYAEDRVVAIKGAKNENQTNILSTPTPVDVFVDGQRFSRGLKLWNLGVSTLKQMLYGVFNHIPPTDEQLENGARYQAGFCHFPEYDEEFFKQITAEQFMLTIDKKGYEVGSWERTRKDNHFLDCRAYARAAAEMLQFQRHTEKSWDDREAVIGTTIPDTEIIVPIDTGEQINDTTKRNSNSIMRPGSKWLGRRRS